MDCDAHAINATQPRPSQGSSMHLTIAGVHWTPEWRRWRGRQRCPSAGRSTRPGCRSDHRLRKHVRSKAGTRRCSLSLTHTDMPTANQVLPSATPNTIAPHWRPWATQKRGARPQPCQGFGIGSQDIAPLAANANAPSSTIKGMTMRRSSRCCSVTLEEKEVHAMAMRPLWMKLERSAKAATKAAAT